MRTRSTIAAFSFGALVLAGCQQQNTPTTEPEPTEPADDTTDGDDEPMGGYGCH